MMMTCEVCNREFRGKVGLGMHKLRAHERNWSTRSKSR